MAHLQSFSRKITQSLAMGLAAVTLLLTASAGIRPAPAAAQGTVPGTCHRATTIKVALAAGQPVNHHIAGTLCTPRNVQGAKRPPIDVLVHGATYDRTYWDFGYDTASYSYVRQALRDGRAVFYYDRLGNGASSKLASAQVTMASDAYALHQVISHFRNQHRYASVNVVGHSFGSMIAQLEASIYNDMDRLVLTGSLQSTGPALINGLVKSVPANQDPAFATAGYDDGWLTGARGTKSVFYNTATADPRVIAYDEAHQGVQSATQFAEGRVQRVLPPADNPTSKITVPVLLVVGAHDALYCGVSLDCTSKQAILDFQKPYYPLVKRLSVQTVAGSGHDITLHPGSVGATRAINEWLRAR